MTFPLDVEGFEHRSLALHISFWGKIRLSLDGKITQPVNRTFLLRDDSNHTVLLKLKRRLLDPIPAILYRNLSIEVAPRFQWYAYFWMFLPLVLFPAFGFLKIPFADESPAVVGVCLVSAIAGSFVAGRLLRANMPAFGRYTMSGLVYGALMIGIFALFFLLSAAMRFRMEQETLERYVEFAHQIKRTEIHKGNHSPTLLSQLLPRNTAYDGAGYPMLSINYAALRFMLRTQKYRELNDTLDFYQRLFEADFRGEDLLALAFETFAVNDTLLGLYLNDWVRTTPENYQPYLARGVYREFLGWESRGYRWASQTSDSSFLQMEWYFDQAEVDLFRALELEPHAIYALMILIDISRARGRLDVGSILMQEGLKMCPYTVRIRQAFMQGLRPRWMGSYAAMEQYAREADKFTAVNPRLRGLHGCAYWDQGTLAERDSDETEAIMLFTKALSYGSYSEFLESRGKAYWRTQNYGAALDDFNRALDQSPGTPHFLILKAKMLYFLNRLPESSVLLDSAASLDPEYAESVVDWKEYAAGVLVVAGYPYYTAKRDEEAIVYYNRALAYYPGSAQAYYYRGMALIHLNRIDAALSDMKSAVQCNPHYFESYLMIDWLLAHNGDWDQIIVYWDRFIALEPTHARAYLERSGTYYHLGNIPASRRDAEKACALGSQEGCRIVERLKTQ